MPDRIPPDLIEEIFSKLPVKTLIRFRFLSKSWRATIGSQEFIKKHLRNLSHHNLILGNFNGSSNLVVGEVYLYSADYDSFLETDCAVFKELNLPVEPRTDLETDILGSCNGLLCVLSLWDDRPIVWNPSTRKHRILPSARKDEFHGVPVGGNCYTCYGFGYDSVSDDYKVVAIPVLYGRDDQVYSKVKVYGLKVESWKRVPDFSYYFHKHVSGKLVDRALYWVVKASESNSNKLIATFDLGTEEFRLLPQPEYFDRHFDMRLGILKGCLSLICEYYESHFDIWVMAEYGVQKSWTNLVSIKICDLSTNCRLSPSCPQAMKPIAYSKCRRRVLLGQAN
ncbi:F-box protein CPR1-like [Coffea arabica]|uniref:F-box protein CPR1-like n=1 Tax=Coffea arabica TaxID=13443 RepID=A0A6P6VJK9_COFAR|nr:F-box protein CPR1-like [Coffea arabica]